jgi:hypothetical protein
LRVYGCCGDLRLDGHVERGGRFVGDQQVGFVGQRHGDHHALALAARELVWVGTETFLDAGEPDQAQQLDGSLARLSRAHAPVQLQRLADLLFDGMQRVQRGHRLLEDHADAIAAHRSQLGLVGGQQVGTVEQHAPARVARLRIGQQA